MGSSLRATPGGMALLIACFARAAEPVPLPPVVVPVPEAPNEQAAREKDPAAVVTDVRADEPSARVSSSAELVERAPSVVVRGQGGFGQAQAVSIRGASANAVTVMLDGIPLGGTGASIDLAALPTGILESIEVLRGGAGARYGMGGMGGAVNLLTRRAAGHRLAKLLLSQGSFGTQKVDALVQGEVLGTSGLLVVHGGRSLGDFPYAYDPSPSVVGDALLLGRRENNQARLGGGLFKVGREGALGSLEALVEAAALSRGLAGPEQNPTADATERSRRVVASIRGRTPLRRGELWLRAHARSERLALAGGLSSNEVQDGREAGLTGGMDYLAGAHGIRGQLELARETLASPTGRPAWTRLGAMAQDELSLAAGALRLFPSLRVDKVGPFVGVSPKVGAIGELPGGFELRANAGQAFRAPSFLELYLTLGHLRPNDQLQPERALFADVGVAHHAAVTANIETNVSVTGFYALYENLISYEMTGPVPPKPFNISTARAVGAEVEGAIQVGGVGTRAAYTYIRTANLRDDPRYFGNDLPYQPRHRLYLSAEARLGALSSHLAVRYQSAQQRNRGRELTLPARAFVDAGVQADLTRAPRLAVAVDVHNLLDVRAQALDGYPLPGRAFFLTLSVEIEES